MPKDIETSRCAACRAVILADARECGRCGADLRTWDIGEGDIVTLPDGAEVEILAVDHDNMGTYFTCTEDGAEVYYYAKDVLSAEYEG